MGVINQWANFLFNEKLDSRVLCDSDAIKLVMLCEKLASIRPTVIKSHLEKIESCRLVCITAFDMGIDLVAVKKRKHTGGTKPAIGRGLLDIWVEEYAKRFGSSYGTNGESEITRRKIVTKLSKEV